MRKANKKENKENRQDQEDLSEYKVGMLVFAQNKQKEWHDAKVIEIRKNKNYAHNPVEQNLEFYVHYEGLNRRWDEWCVYERIKPWNEAESKRDNFNGPIVENNEHEGLDERDLAEHERLTKFKTIDFIEIGKYRCETWYFSPLPDSFQNIDTLYICEFCLSFFRYKTELIRHASRCNLLHPMGNEIYREGNVSVFEVDGARNPCYCENLCYISKLFLDHKTLRYDVVPFLFYVLTEIDEFGCHFAGYFSKQKEDPVEPTKYNLSCILVMPFMQRKGFGKFLISFSYELSRKEQKMGTPERPLSDLGHASYFSWWSAEIIKCLEDSQGQNLSINDISQKTYIEPADVLEVLEKLHILRYSQGNHVLYTNPDFLTHLMKTTGNPGRRVLPENLHWTPLRLIQ
ncbi:unnamed protein product [Blepharisma stoltei]|uniref:Histone acetyltransferase n=1 Tax=Blepharisma stoltei TaxID=1481888 RepID=A0AAU9IDU9_9CILI|nr:unnamed protein product [Blepharisma stoltei]